METEGSRSSQSELLVQSRKGPAPRVLRRGRLKSKCQFGGEATPDVDVALGAFAEHPARSRLTKQATTKPHLLEPTT